MSIAFLVSRNLAIPGSLKLDFASNPRLYMDPSSSSWSSAQPDQAYRPHETGTQWPSVGAGVHHAASGSARTTALEVDISDTNGSSAHHATGRAKDVLAEEQMIVDSAGDELYYRTYRSEAEDLGGLTRLVDQELSEPYNSERSSMMLGQWKGRRLNDAVYTFRYFLVEWPHLTFLVFPSIHSTDPIATIICKQESHRGKTNRGYIGMLSVDQAWRRRGIATKLVKLAIAEMASRGAHEIVLETEYDNASSLALYDSMGFMREKRIQRFYSNLKDAFRLILPLPTPNPPRETSLEAATARAVLSDPPHFSTADTSVHLPPATYNAYSDLYT